MKAPKDMSPEELDLLFFEYLEEELPAAEAEALEQRLAQNPALQNELESWKGSYISQEFYDTERLEEKLLAATPSPLKFSFRTFLNVLLPVLLTVFLSFMLIKDVGSGRQVLSLPERSGAASKPEPVQVRVSQEKPLVAPFPETNVLPDVSPTLKKEETVKTEITSAAFRSEEQQGRMQSSQLPVISRLAIDLNPLTEGVGLEWEVKKVKIPKRARDHNISRRQQRKIQRKKNKALQKRRARGFMKGNVPYVVPLNTQNF